jgi:N-methylhydantoinase B/oxoprolinase/acetone carboxylase alpha subunit
MLPKGTYSGEILADGILHGSKEMSKPIKLKVKIIISEDKIVVDYRGCDMQRERQPINVPYSYTMSDTFYALQYILFDNIQNIGTQYCPVEIILDEKSILNASKPVPVFARCRTGLHISALINFVLQKAVPNKVLAGCGHNIIFRAAGNDVNGNYFAMTFMPKGGMGATGINDGFDCTVYPTNCTMIQTEIAETRAPIIVERKLAVNTAGKGKYRGGAGQLVKITSISEQPLQFSFRPNFIQNPPLGLNGGNNGKSAEILINGGIIHTDPVIINKNEYVTVRTAGGGGLGKYSERSDLNKKKDKEDGIYS